MSRAGQVSAQAKKLEATCFPSEPVSTGSFFWCLAFLIRSAFIGAPCVCTKPHPAQPGTAQRNAGGGASVKLPGETGPGGSRGYEANQIDMRVLAGGGLGGADSRSGCRFRACGRLRGQWCCGWSRFDALDGPRERDARLVKRWSDSALLDGLHGRRGLGSRHRFGLESRGGWAVGRRRTTAGVNLIVDRFENAIVANVPRILAPAGHGLL